MNHTHNIFRRGASRCSFFGAMIRHWLLTLDCPSYAFANLHFVAIITCTIETPVSTLYSFVCNIRTCVLPNLPEPEYEWIGRQRRSRGVEMHGW